MADEKKQYFREQLLTWFAQNHRPLPWKGEKDPYKIWLSEIILQQTRVEQGLPYFQKFVEKYPNVAALANAPEDEVMKLWQGLGYYTRARNLHATAKLVAHDCGGRFPATYEGIRALKGVGDYTAAAIASFAFGLPHAVVDGNVYRVLARYFGIETPTDDPAGKKRFAALANELLDPERPADFNQAIMDFGATHCTPQQAKCPTCPLRPHCAAHLYNKVSELPLRTKAARKKERYFLYAVFKLASGDTFIRKRTGKDIWQNLYEFPMLELDAFPEGREALEKVIADNFLSGQKSALWSCNRSKTYRQVLTHQVISAVFCEIFLQNEHFLEQTPPAFLSECMQVNRIRFKKMYAVPRLIDAYLREQTLTLSLF